MTGGDSVRLAERCVGRSDRRAFGTRKGRRHSRPSLRAAAATSDNRTYVMSRWFVRLVPVMGPSSVPFAVGETVPDTVKPNRQPIARMLRTRRRKRGFFTTTILASPSVCSHASSTQLFPQGLLGRKARRQAPHLILADRERPSYERSLRWAWAGHVCQVSAGGRAAPACGRRGVTPMTICRRSRPMRWGMWRTTSTGGITQAAVKRRGTGRLGP